MSAISCFTLDDLCLIVINQRLLIIPGPAKYVADIIQRQGLTVFVARGAAQGQRLLKMIESFSRFTQHVIGDANIVNGLSFEPLIADGLQKR